MSGVSRYSRYLSSRIPHFSLWVEKSTLSLGGTETAVRVGTVSEMAGVLLYRRPSMQDEILLGSSVLEPPRTEEDLDGLIPLLESEFGDAMRQLSD